MKRVVFLVLPLLLASCGTPPEFSRECSVQYDLYDDFYGCVKRKMKRDVRPESINPLHAADLATRKKLKLLEYGDLLNSQVRQGLITDEQAMDQFADKAGDLF